MDSLKNILSKEVIRRGNDRTIADVIKSMKNGEIVIPAYQRNFVWDNKAQSRFIESLLLNIPVPPIFIKETAIEKEPYLLNEVIDGSQRLRTLLRFDTDILRLTGLEKLKEFNNKKKSELPFGIAAKFFSSRMIQFIIIDKSTDDDIQYDIFERLNQGAIALNPQELRNCIYHGQFNDFLLNLRENEDYKELLSKFNKFKYVPISKNIDEDHIENVLKPDKNRLNDVELILRFFALFENKNSNTDNIYKPPRKEMLNEYMAARTNSRNADILIPESELKDQFLKAVKMVKTVYKNNQFKRYIVDNHSQDWLPTFNKALFDIQMLGLLNYDLEIIEQFKETIYYNFLELSAYNSNFNSALNVSTDQQINIRFKIWNENLKNLFENIEFYVKKYELIKEIHVTNKVCSICGKIIEKTEDADIKDFEVQNLTTTLVHKSCLYKEKVVTFSDSDDNIKRYEKAIIKSLQNPSSLASMMYELIKKRGKVNMHVINELAKENNYIASGHINAIIGVLSKFLNLQVVGKGNNKVFWFEEEEIDLDENFSSEENY